MKLARLGAASLLVHAAISLGRGGDLPPISAERGDVLSEAPAESCNLFVFLDPDCPICERLVTAAPTTDERVVWVAEHRKSGDELRRMSRGRIHIATSPSLFTDAGVRAVPSAILVNDQEVMLRGAIDPGVSLDGLLMRHCRAESVRAGMAGATAGQ